MKRIFLSVTALIMISMLGCEEMYKDVMDDAGKPAPIRNLTVSAGNGQAVLSWLDPTDSGFNHVEITWTPTGGSPVQPYTVAKGVQTLTVTGLTNLTLYTFSVKVIDTKGSIVAQLTITATPADVIAPANASNINSTPANTQIALTWTDPATSDFSYIEVSWTPTGGSPVQPASVSKGIQALTVTGLTSGTSYSFLLKSVDTTGNKSAGLTATISTTAISNAKDITAFSIREPASSVFVTGTISGTTITVAMPEGISLTSLVAAFTTTGSTVAIGATAQTSGVTANNFSTSKTYRVTAADSSFKDYTVSANTKSWSAKTSGLPVTAQPWGGITSSSDGLVLSAIVSYAGIYVSTNGGTTWTLKSTPDVPARSIASSADGSVLFIATDGGDMFPEPLSVSFNSGSTWGQEAPGNEWTSVATAPNGWWAVATQRNGYGDGYIYVGEYDGDAWSWYARTPNLDWVDVAASTGVYYAAAAESNYVYTSNDWGLTWTARTNSGMRAWSSVATSSSGSKIIASVNTGNIYSSSDYGSTWTTLTAAGSRAWQSITVSADGSIIVAAVYGGNIYSSIDGGAHWTTHTSAGVQNWNAVTMSADGSRFAAVADTRYIYVYQ